MEITGEWTGQANKPASETNSAEICGNCLRMYSAAAAVPPFEMKCCLWLNLIEDGSLIH